jgi:hypothetical protein
MYWRATGSNGKAAIHPKVAAHLQSSAYSAFDVLLADVPAGRAFLACVLAAASCRDPHVDLECTADDVDTSAELRERDIACSTCDYGAGLETQVWVELRTSCEPGLTWEAVACGALVEHVRWWHLDGTTSSEINPPECLSERTDEMTVASDSGLEARAAPLGLLFPEPPPAGRYAFDIGFMYGFEPAYFEATLTSRP